VRTFDIVPRHRDDLVLELRLGAAPRVAQGGANVDTIVSMTAYAVARAPAATG
jgi:hypothetical protein